MVTSTNHHLTHTLASLPRHRRICASLFWSATSTHPGSLCRAQTQSFCVQSVQQYWWRKKCRTSGDCQWVTGGAGADDDDDDYADDHDDDHHFPWLSMILSTYYQWYYHIINDYHIYQYHDYQWYINYQWYIHDISIIMFHVQYYQLVELWTSDWSHNQINQLRLQPKVVVASTSPLDRQGLM